MTAVTRPIRFEAKGGRKRAVVGAAPVPEPPATVGRVPRVARLLALAIRYDQLLRDGVVANQSELARLANVTQPRMTQIMNLLHLAPDIQEEILFLPPGNEGRDASSEHLLRTVIGALDWKEQRQLWDSLPRL